MSRRGLTGLSSWNRRLVAVGVFAWCLITTFPLYWVVVTAFKTPPGVVGGPTYIPFVDFTPTLQPFIDLYQGVRGEFFRTFLNSTIVGLSAAAIATAIGAMAAYALVRFEFKVRFGA
ncbi:MAG: carbohydrate ABC transporter permease, partial [Bradyrhizobium sp.]|nr:carbohydrate ABC transporter permease [Bradyrhizobium sp.]MDU6255626.1 hypothetical protein [Staphylococcus warneri]